MMRDTYANGGMNVAKGYINGKEVKVLRDTGCSTVIVKRSLVQWEQLTGKKEICVLIGKTYSCGGGRYRHLVSKMPS